MIINENNLIDCEGLNELEQLASSLTTDAAVIYALMCLFQDRWRKVWESPTEQELNAVKQEIHKNESPRVYFWGLDKIEVK